MSKSSTIAAAIVIAVLIIGGIWWSMSMNQAGNPGTSENTGTTVTPTGTAAGSTSNTDLNRDLTSIDVQMNGLASDSASADQGLSDQPVTQSQL